MAWPQIERGTVIFVNFSQDEVTVAADSRMIASNGTQSDYECKISTFGDKFAFVMAGNASRARGRDNAAWNAHSVAREAWKRESPEQLNDAIGLTLATEQAWIKEMKPIYADPEVIRDRRMRMKPGDDPNLASAVFVATDSMGELIVLSVDVVFDVGLYDSVGKIAVSAPPLKLRKNSQLIAGYGEIIDEFLDKTSVRAKEYMAWFESTIAGFPSREKDARLASKMIELSILLHPKREDLGFPIDLIQMRRKIGLDILSMKKNCSDEENK